MAVTAAVIGTIGTINQMNQSKRAARKQEQANRVQRRMEDVRANRERRAMAARAQRAQAEQMAGGFSAGVGQGSSVVQGAVGGIGSQFASNIGYSQQMQGMAGQASIFQQQSANAQSQASMWGGVASIGGSIFSNAGTISGMFPSSGGTIIDTPKGGRGSYGL